MSAYTPITIDELAALEAMVSEGLKTQDKSALNVLGFGEISMALGWPIDEPVHVCKRTPPFTRAEFRAYERQVGEYIAELRSRGLSVVDTTVMHFDRGDQVIAYLVQPRLSAATLGHNVLAASEPGADHPFLLALAEAIQTVSSIVSIDAQVTNFSWDGTTATLIDVGTPFAWTDDGELLTDIDPFLRVLPLVTRRLIKRDLLKVVSRWSDPRRVAVDTVANLFREGLADWVAPTITAFNQHLGFAEPIREDEARAFYDEDLKTFPRLKRLQMIERWWQTTVRRRPYDVFIEDTTF